MISVMMEHPVFLAHVAHYVLIALLVHLPYLFLLAPIRKPSLLVPPPPGKRQGWLHRPHGRVLLVLVFALSASSFLWDFFKDVQPVYVAFGATCILVLVAAAFHYRLAAAALSLALGAAMSAAVFFWTDDLSLYAIVVLLLSTAIMAGLTRSYGPLTYFVLIGICITILMAMTTFSASNTGGTICEWPNDLRNPVGANFLWWNTPCRMDWEQFAVEHAFIALGLALAILLALVLWCLSFALGHGLTNVWRNRRGRSPVSLA